jgi:putative transposase
MTTPPPLHNRRSIRLPDFDYSQSAEYFITLHVHQNESPLLFGEIHDGEMSLSPAGQILSQVWETLPARYPKILLGPMTIMPNHFHAVIIIDDPGQNTQPDAHSRRGMLLPLIVGYLKMNTAKRINLLRGTPGIPVWQRNYYEHVIRSDKKFAEIETYILNNPLNWTWIKQ